MTEEEIIQMIERTLKEFDWGNYGLDDVDPNDMNAEWVHHLAVFTAIDLGIVRADYPH